MPASAATPAPSIGAPEVVASGISMATGVAPLANGDLLVSDYLGNAVDDFRGGAVVATYGGSLLAPHGLALASNGDAYVANFGTRGTPVADGTVSRLPLGGTQFATFSTGFVGAAGVSVTPQGDLLVADSDGSAVYRVDSLGNFTAIPGQWANPHSAIQLANGDIVIAEYSGNRVSVLHPNGTVTRALTGTGAVGLTPDGLGGFFASLQIDGTVMWVHPDGTTTNVIGGLYAPTALAVQGSYLYITTFTASQSVLRVQIPELAAAPVPTAPAAPTGVTATAGNASTVVSWVAPTSDGGSPITGYTATASPGGASCSTTVGVDANPLSCTISGLTNGTAYTIGVSAINAFGPGPVASLSQHWDFTTSAPFTPPVAGTYRFEAIGGGGGGGAQGLGWAIGGGGGGGAYASGTISLSPTQSLAVTVGAGAPPTPFPWHDAQAGSDSSVTLSGATLIRAGGGAGGLGASGNSGGAGGTWSIAPTLGSPAGFNGGNGGPALIVASFADGYHQGGEGGSAANSTGAGYAGTTTRCIHTAVPVPGDLPAGAGGPGNYGGYGPSSTCPTPTNIGPNGGTYGGGGGGVKEWMNGGAGGSGFVRVSLVSVTPDTLPNAPSNITASSGSGSASVTWAAPSGNGGSPITGYTVTSSPSGGSCVVTGTSAACSGLTNGTSYTFSVSAQNAAGSSPAATSNAVTPATVAGAPTGVAAVAGNASTVVSWVAPASDGGSPITGYTATAYPGGASCSTTVGVDVNPLSCAITGLVNGTAYSVYVVAHNAAGDSVGVDVTTPLGSWSGWGQLGSDPAGNLYAASSTQSGGSAVIRRFLPDGTSQTLLVPSSPWWPDYVSVDATSPTDVFYTDQASNPFACAGIVWHFDGISSTPVGPAGTCKPSQLVLDDSGHVYFVDVRHDAYVNAGTDPVYYRGNATAPYNWTISTQADWQAAWEAQHGPVTNSYNGWIAKQGQVTFTAGSGQITRTTTAQAVVTPRTFADAPTGVSATAGNASVSVAWTAPASDGGSPITGYTVSSTPKAGSCAVTGVTASCTGLTNGTSYTFSVTASNAVGTSGSSAPSSAVAPIEAVSVTTPSLPAAMEGASYSQQLEASGGTSPYSWVVLSGSLPPGLSLTNGGVLQGTATASGSYSFSVGVSDSSTVTESATQSFTLTVVLLAITTTSLPAGTVGTPYAAQLAASGGNAPYKWTLASGTKLPKGIKLNEATGALGGTPKLAGTYTVTIQLADTKTKTKPPVQHVTTATFIVTVS